MNEEFLQLRYGGFRLRTWAGEGVDVAPLLRLSRFWDPETGLFHGDISCPDFLTIGALPPSVTPLSLDSRLCEVCWAANPLPELVPLCAELRLVLDALAALRGQRSAEASAYSFGALAPLCALLSECVLVAPWASRVRSLIVAALLSPLGDRSKLRDRLLGKLSTSVSALSGEEGLLFVPAAVGSLSSLLHFEHQLLLAWWVEDAPVPGILVRAPLDVVEFLYEQLGAQRRPGRASGVQLEGDSPEVVSTALALLDMGSEVLSDLRLAFEVARSL